MEELKFVLKCLLFSCLIVTFSQTRISGETLENKAMIFFKYSETAHWIRAAADGGVKLIRQGAEKGQIFISQTFGNKSDSSFSLRRSLSSPQEQQPALSNTGLFRKLEKNRAAAEKAQQLGETTEPELNEDNLSTEE